MIYLVRFKPLGEYTFGTDQGFAYPGEKSSKESYIVPSALEPEQTSILGMLRYSLLSHKGLIKSDFVYTDDEKKEMKNCVGAASFSFNANNQDFGHIKSISPLFIVDDKEQIYIKNPFNNKAAEEGYEPIELSEEAVNTSHGNIRLPKDGEYDPKKGHASGYICLKDRKIKRDLFKTHFVTGIRKNGRESNDKSFFKLEMVNMDKNYSFAIFVDSDLEEKDFIKETIGYLGKKKNPFAVTAKPWNNVGVYNGTEPIEVFLQEVRNAFSGLQTQQKYYLALSDVLLKEKVFYNGFAIVEEKQIRNIETDYDAKKYNDKFKRSSCRFNLISAGSVFYEEPGFDYNNSDLKKTGYNNIVEIGG